MRRKISRALSDAILLTCTFVLLFCLFYPRVRLKLAAQSRRAVLDQLSDAEIRKEKGFFLLEKSGRVRLSPAGQPFYFEPALGQVLSGSEKRAVSVRRVFCYCRRSGEEILAVEAPTDELKGYSLTAAVLCAVPLGALVLAPAAVAAALRARRLRAAEVRRKEKADLLLHELRAPLTNLCCLMESSGNGMLDAPDTALALSEARRMGRLIARFSPAKSGGIPLKIESFDLSACVREAVGAFRVAAQEAGLKLSYRAKRGARYLFTSDRDLTIQVVTNLIENSLRAHADTHLTLSEKSTQDGRFLILRIFSAGAHIPTELSGRLFEKGASTRPGGGLGLWLSQTALKSLGATLDFENINSGVLFTLSFPAPSKNS